MTRLFFTLCLITTVTLNGQNTSSSIKTQEHSIENHSLSEEIKGQLQTFENLRIYLKEKRYNDVISLFTLETQYYLKLIQKDEERFKTWYQAWTYEEATYENYVAEIKKGRGVNLFDFEDGEWRINQK